MKRYIICLLIPVIFTSLYVAADIEHVVKRGESIESIARKYGMSSEKLLEANKDAATLFYIGQRLKIPTEQSTEHEQTNYGRTSNACNIISPIEQGLAEDAKRYFENKDWRKAVKTYNKLIKNYPKAVYYYNRGLSQLNNNKNRQAANDFRKALSMNDCTSSMQKNGPNLLAEAEKRHKEWKDRQTNLIGSIVLGAAAVGLTTWAVVESSKIESVDNRNTYTNSLSSGAYSQSTDMNQVYNQIMTKTIHDGQMQELSEYEQARTAWRQMTGNDLSLDEWRAQKGQAILNMQSKEFDVKSNTNFNSDYWNEANRKERQRQILNTVAGEKCSLCKGSGKCHACNGTKIASGMGNSYACTLCNDKGDCPLCNGSGLASWNR